MPPNMQRKLKRAHVEVPRDALYGWLRRQLAIFGIYSIAVYWNLCSICMAVFSVACLARTAITLGAYPMPLAVQLYVASMAWYYVTCYHKPHAIWNELNAFTRRSLAEYPYFRRMICIFEDHEDECLSDPHKPMVEANARCMFAFHPHGMVPNGFVVNGSDSMRFERSEARWLVGESMFWCPITRELSYWRGYDNVRKSTFIHHMGQDRNVCLLPGGFNEATLYERGKHRVYIKKRFGFIKLALQFGYKLRVAYTFGEEETYHAFSYFLKQRLWLNKWKLGVAFWGRRWAWFMPREDVALTTVVSKPIQLPQIENPTRAEVAKYHQLYVDTLVGLFERHKHKYAKDPTATLELC